MIVEVCATSLLSIKNASQAGEDRIELCSALEIGGLTPSLGLIKQSIEDNLLPIHCLIRPRQGHFFYSDSEIKIIEQNIENAVALGCHGIVFGMHNENFELDFNLLKRFKSIVGSKFLTFHRAFDVILNPEKAINILIELGFDCILSSGQHEKAIDGIDNLKRWNDKFGHKISIMPGSGVDRNNCIEFKNAGFKSIHLSGGVDNLKLKPPKEINKNLSFLKQNLRESDSKIISAVVDIMKSNSIK